MFSIDFIVAYGLSKRKRWGWHIAIILFMQQIIMQPYWAYRNYQDKFYIIHPAERFIPSMLVIMSFFILILNRKIYKTEQR